MQSLPKPLCATDKSSFAYKTIKDRLPVIITRAVDYLSRFHNNLIDRYSQNASDDIKFVIDRLSQLRYELTTDKPLRPLNDKYSDSHLWNEALNAMEAEIGFENLSWFRAPWLFSECYMYRRINEAIFSCESDLKYYDPYDYAKRESYKTSEESILGLIKTLCPIDLNEEKNNTEMLRKKCETIIQLCLWSNKNDLSISAGVDNSDKIKNLVYSIDIHKSFLVSNEIENVVEEIFSGEHNRFDIVLDNASIEFVSDLLFADFLLRNQIYNQVHLHFKAYSWFVSDVTIQDYDYTIQQLQRVNSIQVDQFLRRVNAYRTSSKLVLSVDKYWTTPYGYHEMKTIDKQLYTDLEKSNLILFKGDLNYRKLLGDLNWPLDTSLKVALRGFLPSSLFVLRTMKSDLAAGLNLTTADAIRAKCPDWMINGDYGLIQFIKSD